MPVPEADLRADSPVSDRPAAPRVRETGPLLAVLIARGGTALRDTIRRPEATIGRGGDNDVVLSDPSVSEHHAVLRLAGGVWTLSDAGSVNGSWVDGEPVQGGLPVASGSTLRLGAVELVFAGHDRWEDSPPPSRGLPRDRPGYVLSAGDPSRIPAAVMIGGGIFLLALVGYLLARVA